MIAWLGSLAQSASFWEAFEYTAELFVVIGALGEFVTEFGYFPRGDPHKELRHRLGKFSAVVLIIALAIELGALVKTNQLSDETIAGLNMQAKTFEKRVAEVKNEAKIAEAHAAELEADNLDLRQVLTSQRYLKDGKPDSKIRSLNVSGINLFTESISDSEPSGLLRQISSVISSLKWRNRITSNLANPNLIRPGVEVWTDSSKVSPPDTKEIRRRSWLAGEIISKWLVSQGINFVVHRTIPEPESEYKKSLLFSEGAPPSSLVAVLVGGRDIDKELEILRQKRLSRLRKP